MRRQRKGPRGERPGMRVRCNFQPPATLAGQAGTLIREIQNGRQWFIELDDHTLKSGYSTGYCWLWTSEFELIPKGKK